jgi:DNA replication protein DnaC
MPAQTNKDLAHLCRELKAPSLLAAIERLAKRARDESWSHEEFLAACLEREVAARQTHGGEGRIKAARFPSHKTLEDFDFSYQRSIRKDVVMLEPARWEQGHHPRPASSSSNEL